MFNNKRGGNIVGVYQPPTKTMQVSRDIKFKITLSLANPKLEVDKSNHNLTIEKIPVLSKDNGRYFIVGSQIVTNSTINKYYIIDQNEKLEDIAILENNTISDLIADPNWKEIASSVNYTLIGGIKRGKYYYPSPAFQKTQGDRATSSYIWAAQSPIKGENKDILENTNDYAKVYKKLVSGRTARQKVVDNKANSEKKTSTAPKKHVSLARMRAETNPNPIRRRFFHWRAKPTPHEASRI